MTENLIKEQERLDDLQNGCFIIQDPGEILFRYGCCSAVGLCKNQKE